MRYGDSALRSLLPDRLGPRLADKGRRMIAPYLAGRARLNGKTFESLDGDRLPYLVDPYNTTWRNERSIEIPLAKRFLESVSGVGIELGNVLVHYGVSTEREVIDLYERAPGVTNVDILDYSPSRSLDFIVSVSTIEHVGWDEHPRQPGRAARALDHARSLLSPGGQMFVTIPLGYNHPLDEAIVEGRFGALRESSFTHESEGWVRHDRPIVLPYDGRGGRGARAVWVATLPPSDVDSKSSIEAMSRPEPSAEHGSV